MLHTTPLDVTVEPPFILIVALIIAILITCGYLLAILNPPSFFNIIPYTIHESINKGGGGEATFIEVFDYCFAVILLMLSYILARDVLKAYRVFS